MTCDSSKKESDGLMAYVTLVTSETYAIGAKVLAKSLRKVETRYKIICLVTPNISSSCLSSLKDTSAPLFDEVRMVQPLDSNDAKNLAALGRPELGCTFTKIQVWAQTDLSKVIFLDADMIVIKNIDNLFIECEELSACPDVGWPDCFNSGLFVCRPSLETCRALLKHADEVGSFDGGDQGLLNTFFSDWSKGNPSRRIPFGYNLTFNASYSYLPAFKHFQDEIRVVHFIGYNKPWTFHRFADGRVAPRGDYHGEHLEFVQQWWALHDEIKGQPQETTVTEPKNYGQSRNDYHASSHSNYTYSPPPVSFSPNSHNFGNYKISWSRDVEIFFNQIDLSERSPTATAATNKAAHKTAPKE